MGDAPEQRTPSPGGRVGAFLKLTRFPLVFTAIADSAAGYLLTLPAPYRPDPVTLALLAATSACLYASGMVFNDVADYLRDAGLTSVRRLTGTLVTGAATEDCGGS